MTFRANTVRMASLVRRSHTNRRVVRPSVGFDHTPCRWHVFTAASIAAATWFRAFGFSTTPCNIFTSEIFFVNSLRCFAAIGSVSLPASSTALIPAHTSATVRLSCDTLQLASRDWCRDKNAAADVARISSAAAAATTATARPSLPSRSRLRSGASGAPHPPPRASTGRRSRSWAAPTIAARASRSRASPRARSTAGSRPCRSRSPRARPSPPRASPRARARARVRVRAQTATVESTRASAPSTAASRAAQSRGINASSRCGTSTSSARFA
mmetsp:Transcript_8244/g.30118  ORF Transcript_8244/g.30118 Transcript_8244/m.30118 type:complete len:271 (-) Transcript_8244:893-1705(-)